MRKNAIIVVFITMVIVGIYTLVTKVKTSKEETSDRQRPNVIIITTDQQRIGSLSCYGNRLIETPCLDALAEDGIRFNRAYTPHPTSTPARAAILTGQFGSTNGAYTIGTALPYDSPKMSDVAAANGYETYFIGKMHFRPVSTEGEFESEPNILDEEFWRGFEGPLFGFQHVQMLNRHSSEHLACREHYGIWLKDEKGLTEEDLKEYFRYQGGSWDLPLECHPSVFISEKTNKFIDRHLQEKGDKPFLMWVSFTDPHPPHVVPSPYDTLVSPDEIEIKELKENEFADKPPVYQELHDKGPRGMSVSDKFGVPCAGPVREKNYTSKREAMAIYHGMVRLIDDEIAKIIRNLKEKGLYDNTIIIFTTDHGEYGGNHGFMSKGFPAFEEAYNIPFIVKNVNSVNKGKVSEALVSSLDIAPSVLDVAGIDLPDFLQGVSQKEVFTGRKKSVRDNVVIENRPIQKGLYQKMVVTDRYKLVYYYQHSYGELYDLSRDRDQYHNLWDDPQFKEVKDDLLYQLYRAYARDNYIKKSKLDTKGLLQELDRQIAAEGEVQPRTSFS